jgi:hypothetical protein
MEPRTAQHPTSIVRRVHQTLVPLLEGADAVVYALVGSVFLVAALGMLGYSVIAFPGDLRKTGFALAIVTLVNDLLLVMIIMEVLRTVLSYLQERGTSLQPFLFIAAISATRRDPRHRRRTLFARPPPIEEREARLTRSLFSRLSAKCGRLISAPRLICEKKPNQASDARP